MTMSASSAQKTVDSGTVAVGSVAVALDLDDMVEGSRRKAAQDKHEVDGRNVAGTTFRTSRMTKRIRPVGAER